MPDILKRTPVLGPRYYEVPRAGAAGQLLGNTLIETVRNLVVRRGFSAIDWENLVYVAVAEMNAPTTHHPRYWMLTRLHSVRTADQENREMPCSASM